MKPLRVKDISVRYGRPYKKGRDIFGGLVPYGKSTAAAPILPLP